MVVLVVIGALTVAFFAATLGLGLGLGLALVLLIGLVLDLDFDLFVRGTVVVVALLIFGA